MSHLAIAGFDGRWGRELERWFMGQTDYSPEFRLWIEAGVTDPTWVTPFVDPSSDAGAALGPSNDTGIVPTAEPAPMELSEATEAVDANAGIIFVDTMEYGVGATFGLGLDTTAPDSLPEENLG